MLPIQRSEPIYKLIRQLNNGPNEMARAAAAKQLGDLGDPRAAEVLVTWLNDSYPLLYKHTVQAVKKLGGAALRQFFPLTAVGVCLQNIVIALRECGDADAVELLISIFSHPDLDHAADAALAIKSIGITTVPALICALSSPDMQTRRLSANLLGEFKAPESIDPLFESLKDADDKTAPYLATAIASMGELLNDRALIVLSDKDWRMRLAGLSIFHKTKDERGLPGILRLFKSDDQKLRGYAAWALSGYGTKSLEFLANALHDNDPRLRRMAVFALGEIGTRDVVPIAGNACSDPRKTIRHEAFNVLYKICDPAAIPFIIKALSSDSSETRAKAARGLYAFNMRAKINNPKEMDWKSVQWSEVEAAILPLLEDSSQEVREKAQEAIELIKRD